MWGGGAGWVNASGRVVREKTRRVFVPCASYRLGQAQDGPAAQVGVLWPTGEAVAGTCIRRRDLMQAPPMDGDAASTHAVPGVLRVINMAAFDSRWLRQALGMWSRVPCPVSRVPPDVGVRSGGLRRRSPGGMDGDGSSVLGQGRHMGSGYTVVRADFFLIANGGYSGR